MNNSKTYHRNMNIDRYQSIDIIKGIAMIMIILVHYGQNYQLKICEGMKYLQMGCPVFFVASGFGIMCLINKKFNGVINIENAKRFYITRFMAFAPGWYIAFIIIFLANTIAIHLIGKPFSFGVNRNAISIICNLLFIHGLLPFCNNDVMPGGWYIGTTIILYFLTPFFLKCMYKVNNRRRFFVSSTIVGILLWIILYFVFKDSFTRRNFSYYFFLIHYPEYMLGIMLYYDLSDKIINDTQLTKSLVLGIILLLFSVVFFYIPISFGLIISAWMTAIATYLILYYMLSYENKKGHIATCRKIRIVEEYGKNSFYIYLLHAFFAWPLVSISIKAFGKIRISEKVSFIVLLPCVLILSYIAGIVLKTVVKTMMKHIIVQR